MLLICFDYKIAKWRIKKIYLNRSNLSLKATENLTTGTTGTDQDPTIIVALTSQETIGGLTIIEAEVAADTD